MDEVFIKYGVFWNVIDNNGIILVELVWRVGNYELCNFLFD